MGRIWSALDASTFFQPAFEISIPQALSKKHFLKRKLAKERGGFEQEGPSSCGAWHRLQLSLLSRAELPLQLPWAGALPWLLGSLCPQPSCSWAQRGWRAALERDWGLCLSDPLNLIMNELSPHLPWWHKFIYFCLPSAMVRRGFPFSPWGKHEKNKGLDFHGLMRQEKSLHW